MSSNSLEQVVYNCLQSHPRLRHFFGVIYLRAMYCVARIKSICKPFSAVDLEVCSVTDKNKHCFFGYYEKSPWNRTQQYFLYHQVDFVGRMPRSGETVKLCFVDLHDNNNCRTFAETSAWSWQQGSMLQWVCGDCEDLIIYNDFQDGRYVSVICDLEGREHKILPHPIQSISSDGKKALGVNFARLHHGYREGYGYVSKPYEACENLCPDDDGVWYIDVQTGEQKMILSFADFSGFLPKGEFQEAFHYVDQIQFNPAGDRFVALHRWFITYANGVRSNLRMRMITSRLDGTDMYCLCDHGIISHYCWRDNNNILAWADHDSCGRRYYLFTDKTEEVQCIGDGILTEDGHPSYSPAGRWVITDTYPDKARFRTLILYDTLSGKRFNLGRFHAPFKMDGPWRCDLHPRWSRDGRQVCFDSIHDGRRAVYVADVSSFVLNEIL